MSTSKNKAAVRLVIEEAMNKGNLAVLDGIMAPNYVYHYPAMEVKGPDGFKQFVAIMRKAFPDIHVTIDDIVAEGDMVASRFTLRGTFKGEMMGMAPTGKRLNITEAVFIRFKGDKEVEATPYSDSLAFYRQLGISPPTG